MAVIVLTAAGGCGSSTKRAHPISQRPDTSSSDDCGAGKKVFNSSVLHRVEIDLSVEDWRAMIREAKLTEEEDAKTYFPAALRFDGTSAGVVGVRLKGHYSLSSASGHSFPFKIDFDRVVRGQLFDGLKKLNLHPDNDLSVLREYLSYGALREFGIATARTAFAQVIVNEEALGLYNAVEQMNGRFIRCRFEPPYGDLYKPVSTLAFAGPSIDDHPTANHKWPDKTDHRAFLHMVDVINHGELGSLSEVLDVEGALTYFAGNDGIGNADEYRGAQNYYLYEHVPGQFAILPWDMNLSQEGYLGPCGPGRETSDFPISHRLLGDAKHVARYVETLTRFIEGPASVRTLGSRLDEALKIIGGYLSPEGPDELRSVIEERVAGLTVDLPGLSICPEKTRLFE